MTGTCLHCHGQKNPPKKLLAPLAEYEQDPFCSTQCAKAHHGVVHAGEAWGMGGGTVGYYRSKPVAA